VDYGETVREELLAGSYRPKPVRRQEIPKSGGGVRKLGTSRDLAPEMGRSFKLVYGVRF
jgi:hypothetical protein